MRIFQLARELGQSLLETQTFQAFQEAEIDALNDEGVQELLHLIEVTDDESQQVALSAALEQSPRYRLWQERSEQFDRLVTLVLDQVSYHISATLRTDVPCGVHTPPPEDRLHERPFQLAQGLAIELLSSDEYRAYEEAERMFLTDGQVLQLINDLRESETQLRSFNYQSPEEGDRLRLRIEELRQQLSHRPTYEAYMDARNAFDSLLGMVLDAVSFEITGTGRPDSGCGTAGANCGCGSGLNLPPVQRIERTLLTALSG